MRISCPYCGERDAQEFIYRGDASPRRPEGEEGFVDYVYLRDNPAGLHREHWHHSAGCHSWLRVQRDLRSHLMQSAALAGPQEGER